MSHSLHTTVQFGTESVIFQEQHRLLERTEELAESTDKISNLEFELKQAQDKLSSSELSKSNLEEIDAQRLLTIHNMEIQDSF